MISMLKEDVFVITVAIYVVPSFFGADNILLQNGSRRRQEAGCGIAFVGVLSFEEAEDDGRDL